MAKQIKSWLADKPDDHIETQLERAKKLQEKLEGHIENGELDAEMLATATRSLQLAVDHLQRESVKRQELKRRQEESK